MLAELSRREKEANIKPDPDIDVYMKVRQKIQANDLNLGKNAFLSCGFFFFF
jgi:hypothetical protein